MKALATLLLFLFPAVGLAETAANPPVRARVTLIANPSQRSVGTLLALSPGQVTFRDSTEHQFGRADVARLEISHGLHGHPGKGAWIGVLVLGAAGVIVGANSYVGEDRGIAALGLGALGVGAGLGLGVLVGGAIRTERWREVAVP
jgi:hypothetical protein